MHTPAAQGAAMMLRIEFTLETFEHVTHLGEAILLKRQPRID